MSTHKKKINERTNSLFFFPSFFLRLPVLRVLFPKGPQGFPLNQPVSAYHHYYILLVPDIPLLRYETALALLSITPAMSKWAQCFTSANS